MQIGKRLLDLRMETGKSQKDFAAALGVKDVTKYNKWEKGKSNPDYPTLCELAERLHVSTDYLLGRDNAKTPEYVTVVSELGLSENSIDTIKLLAKESLETKYIEGSNFTYLDVLNALLEEREDLLSAIHIVSTLALGSIQDETVRNIDLDASGNPVRQRMKLSVFYKASLDELLELFIGKIRRSMKIKKNGDL